ncbi:MAG: hypothetical protein KKF56_05625 [Nanoarchaeota archaeon]|nr:hypothetical protein [Nanoarchaeota archaeon]
MKEMCRWYSVARNIGIENERAYTPCRERCDGRKQECAFYIRESAIIKGREEE